MNDRLQVALLADGRLHLRDGPIDLLIRADGAVGERERAFQAATRRFRHVLDALCAELPQLRQPACLRDTPLTGPIALRMNAVTARFLDHGFITPMAAVAGAVADDVLAAMVAGATLTRAFVNNGGDIALHLAAGQELTAGLVADIDHPAIAGTVTIHAGDAIRGIATSGRGGRSFSLGIADAVTVLARTAAEADAAATVIANAVDLPGHPAVTRRPARALQPDSDLGDRPVTTALGPLSADEITTALVAGEAKARTLLADGHIAGAALSLRGKQIVVGGEGRFVGKKQRMVGVIGFEPTTPTSRT